MEVPMIVLGLVWLLLLVLELTWGWSRLLETTGTVIWVIFVVDFVVKFAIAPRKWPFVRGNWLTILSLVVPALRVFRIVRLLGLLRAARAVRGLRLFRLVSSLNRGMRALRGALGRRGFGYVIALTVVVVFSGAAGMLAFENDIQTANGIHDFGTALWWTAMVVVTMGSEYWPRTPEGRILCLLLAVYAFTVFGYVTATLASFFIGRDADSQKGEVAGSRELRLLREEVKALRAAMSDLSVQLKAKNPATNREPS
jgi:voltage-gated potassium channel